MDSIYFFEVERIPEENQKILLLVLIGLGYMIGKGWGRRPIDKGFPEQKK